MASFGLVLVISLSYSCHTTADHSSAVGMIDTLITTMENVTAETKADFPDDELAALPDSLYASVQYLQDHFVGKMKKDQAIVFGNYSEVLDERENLNTEVKTFMHKSDSLIGQLKSLKQALKEHATHDKSNNEITKEYVVRAVKNESANVTLFVSRGEYLSIQKESLNSKITKSYLDIKLKTDSMSKKKKTT